MGIESQFEKNTKYYVSIKAGKIPILDNPVTYCNEKLEMVTSYKYLGLDIHCTGSFNLAIHNLYVKGMKAMFKLTKSICNYRPSSSTLFHLFDMMVKPVLLYSAEIWGVPKIKNKNKTIDSLLKSFHTLQSEKCHQKFSRYVLGVHKKTSLDAVYGDTGRYPICINIIINILKYWSRLCSSSNSLMHYSLNENIALAKNGKHSWTSAVYTILECLGLERFKDPTVTANEQIPVLNIVKQLKTCYDSNWSSNVKSGGGKGIEHSKLRTYVLFKTEHCNEAYLNAVTNVQHRISLAKFRCSSHKLNIEIGRYKGLPVDQRLCTLCNNNKVEDECHFFSECSAYSQFRTPLFDTLSTSCKQFSSLSNQNKFIWAMSNPDTKICQLIAKFIHECFNYRENVLQVQVQQND